MKNNNNIYDIDGELIRNIDDLHGWTVDEAKQKVEYYQAKLKELPEGDPKRPIYENYIRNLNVYRLNLILKDPNTFLKNVQVDNRTDEEKAVDALKELIEEANNDGDAETNTKDEISGETAGSDENTANEEPGDDVPVGRDDSDIHEERSVTQSDLLVPREEVNTSMDEYVQFEEITE